MIVMAVSAAQGFAGERIVQATFKSAPSKVMVLLPAPIEHLDALDVGLVSTELANLKPEPVVNVSQGVDLALEQTAPEILPDLKPRESAPKEAPELPQAERSFLILDRVPSDRGASGESLSEKAQSDFDLTIARPALYKEASPAKPWPLLKGLAVLAPALTLTGCQGNPHLASLPAIGQSPLFKAVAEKAYWLGNGISFVIDLPRLFAAARSRNPEAVSVLSNAILMMASLLLAVRAFLGHNILWARQNLFSGIVPMTIILLQFDKTKAWFPKGRTDGSSESYSLGVSVIRAGMLLAIGCAVVGVLDALGMAFLAPLGAESFSAPAQFLLQLTASTGFISYLIPQIRKVKSLRSTEGLSLLLFYSVLVVDICLGLWAADNALLEVKATLPETLKNLEFWKFAVHLAQTSLEGFYSWSMIQVIGQLRRPLGPKSV